MPIMVRGCFPSEVSGSWIVAYITGWPTSIAPATAGIALGFSAAVGIFFGFWSARKAASIDPISALRYE